MRRNGVWDVIRNSSRSSNRSKRKRPVKQNGKGLWTGVADTVLFQPHKSEWTPIWRGTYKLKRELKDIERRLNQPPTEETWWSALKGKFRSACLDVVDECRALATLLFFHIVTLFMIVVFNVAWFAFLFWVIGLWLGG